MFRRPCELCECGRVIAAIVRRLPVTQICASQSRQTDKEPLILSVYEIGNDQVTTLNHIVRLNRPRHSPCFLHYSLHKRNAVLLQVLGHVCNHGLHIRTDKHVQSKLRRPINLGLGHHTMKPV